MRSGAVQEVCGNGGIKNLQYKPTRASASISIICKIGKYKEKRTKDVDTSRMGVN
jgi:membrane-bound lytic murein transglycosylase MltF